MGRLALDEAQCVPEAGERLAVDGVGLEIGAEPLHDVGDEAKEDARVGDEELRLVVVADERQPALEDAPLVDVGDLRREVVALDAVGVVQEVERVVDGEAEPRPPRDEALVDLGRDADLGDLVEDLRARRSAARPASCRRAAPSMTWRLRSSVKTSESNRGLVMTSVSRSSTLSSTPGSATAFDEVEDLLLEQELLFMVEHGPNASIGGRRDRRA